jgi:hypothetical protein
MTSKCLLIQSADRVIGTPDDFEVPVPLIRSPKSVSLLSCSMPNTMYNITAANNTIHWDRGGPLSASLTPGAYTSASLETALAAAMNVADSTFVYAANYSSITMKMVISCTAPFTLTCTNTTSAIWNVLGFNTTANTSSAVSHIGDTVLRLDFPSYLMINVDQIPAHGVISTANRRACFTVANVMNSGGLNIYTAKLQFENKVVLTNIDAIAIMHIRVTKPDGTAVDLNGAEWTILMEFNF